MYYCYILQSLVNGKYYVGATENKEKRLRLHNSGKVRSTKSGRPWKLVFYEEYATLRETRRRELQIKKWKSRVAIERLMDVE